MPRRKTGGTHKVLNPRNIPAEISVYAVRKAEGSDEMIEYFENDTFTPPEWLDVEPDIKGGFLEVINDG